MKANKIEGIHTFTSTQAIEILERTTHQRPVSTIRVQIIAGDLKAGRWKLNGESIVLSWNDEGEIIVLDGQHRLWACAEADMPLKSYVSFVEDRGVFDTFDQGGVRSGADVASVLLETRFRS
jgi:hypothetical protein